MTDEIENRKTGVVNLAKITPLDMDTKLNNSVIIMDEITRSTVSGLRKGLRDAVAKDLRILKKYGLVP